MQGFNKVILAGNLTRDPQLKYLPNNTAVCEFGLAMNRKWRDKDGNQHEDVTFVDIAAFGRQGEMINQYMTKGRSLLVEGRLKFDQWTGQDGTKRSRLSVVAENFTFLGGPRDGAGGGGSSEYGGAPAARSASPPNRGYERNDAGTGAGSATGSSGGGYGYGNQRAASAAPAAAAIAPPAAAAATPPPMDDSNYDSGPPVEDRPPGNDDIPF